MKISKAYIKRVILEELSRLEEETPAPEQLSLPFKKPSAEEIKKQKDNLKIILKQKTSDLLAAKAASDKINSLQKEIDEINNQIASMGG